MYYCPDFFVQQAQTGTTTSGVQLSTVQITGTPTVSTAVQPVNG